MKLKRLLKEIRKSPNVYIEVHNPLSSHDLKVRVNKKDLTSEILYSTNGEDVETGLYMNNGLLGQESPKFKPDKILYKKPIQVI